MVSKSRILARKRGRKRVDWIVMEGKFQGEEGGQAKRISPGESVCGTKNSPGGSEECWFHSKSRET